MAEKSGSTLVEFVEVVGKVLVVLASAAVAVEAANWAATAAD